MNRLTMTYNSLTRLNYRNSTGGLDIVKIKVDDEEKDYCVLSESMSTGAEKGSWWDYHNNSNLIIYSYELEEILRVRVKTKTKEEIAAEESVAKAKEALKAAENALEVLTSQKEQSK